MTLQPHSEFHFDLHPNSASADPSATANLIRSGLPKGNQEFPQTIRLVALRRLRAVGSY